MPETDDGSHLPQYRATAIAAANISGPTMGVAVAGSGFPKAGAAIACGSALASIGAAYLHGERYVSEDERGRDKDAYPVEHGIDTSDGYAAEPSTQQENMRGVITFVEEHEPQALPDDYKERWEELLE